MRSEHVARLGRMEETFSSASGGRILVIKLSSIGDVVMATPVAQALREALPDAYIAWVVEEKSKDVVIRNPYLDEVIVWERDAATSAGIIAKGSHFVRSLGGLVRELRRREFDLAIDLQGLFRSALVSWLSGARLRLGFGDAREGSIRFYNRVLPPRDRRIRTSREYLNMLSLLGIENGAVDMHVPMHDDDRAFAGQFLSAVCHSRDSVVVLCPATTWPNKHWTEDGWAALADELASNYGALPLFLGARADRRLVSRIMGKMRYKAASAVGETTLRQASAILEQSRMVIGVDSGLLHVAVALDKPVIGVFGPSGWQNFVKKDNFVPVAKDFPCIPCFRHPTCKEFDCMKAIAPEDVLRVARTWLVRRVET